VYGFTRDRAKLQLQARGTLKEWISNGDINKQIPVTFDDLASKPSARNAEGELRAPEIPSETSNPADAEE